MATHAVHFTECNLRRCCTPVNIFAIDMSWQQKMRFVREPNMIQKVWIVFDCVTKPFTHCNTFCHVSLCELLLYLDLVRIQMKIWRLKDTPQKLSRDPQFLTTPSKRFLWTPSDWLPYFIDVSFCPSTHPPTGMSVCDALRVKILHNTMLSKLLNPVKNSAFWWSISTPKLSLKICLHDRVWFVGKIGFHTKCLFHGRPGHVGEYNGLNFSCTESTSYPKKKEKARIKFINFSEKYMDSVVFFLFCFLGGEGVTLIT